MKTPSTLMVREPERVVADIIAAAGGRLVSRIRLQKLAYLLDHLGMTSGFNYAYRHYGPYSKDLDAAVFDAEAFDLIEEKYDRRKLDGARFSIFELKADIADHEFSYLHEPRLRNIVKRLIPMHVTVLELAATAHWLVKSEKIEDWRIEIVRRKGSKASKERLAEAMQLLDELELPPCVRQA